MWIQGDTSTHIHRSMKVSIIGSCLQNCLNFSDCCMDHKHSERRNNSDDKSAIEIIKLSHLFHNQISYIVTPTIDCLFKPTFIQLTSVEKLSNFFRVSDLWHCDSPRWRRENYWPASTPLKLSSPEVRPNNQSAFWTPSLCVSACFLLVVLASIHSALLEPDKLMCTVPLLFNLVHQQLQTLLPYPPLLEEPSFGWPTEGSPDYPLAIHLSHTSATIIEWLHSYFSILQ